MCADGDNFIKDSGIDMMKNKLVKKSRGCSRVQNGGFQGGWPCGIELDCLKGGVRSA